LRPGLSDAGAKLSPAIGTEILELQQAVQTAHTEYVLTVAPMHNEVRARAQDVLREITAALGWWLNDTVVDDRHRQLAALKAEHAGGSSSANAVATALADYAALARQETEGLEGLGSFDTALIAQAEMLSRQLRECPTRRTVPENTRRALDMRNRVATLLVDRMGQVRAAARYVFRRQRVIALEAGSAFERRRRSASRAAGKSKRSSPANPSVPGVTNLATSAEGANR